MSNTRKNFYLALAGCFLVLSTATASRVPARGNPPPVVNVKSKVQKRKPLPRGSEQKRSWCGEMTEDIDTDLTGTEFSGTILYPAAGIDQRTAAKLVITEIDPTSPVRTFTLTVEGKPALSGLFSARTTCGYTGAAMRFEDSTVSVRACRERDGTAFRSIEAEGFEFVADNGPAPGGPVKWGRCYRTGRLRGNRPL